MSNISAASVDHKRKQKSLDALDKKSYNLRAHLPDQPGGLFR